MAIRFHLVESTDSESFKEALNKLLENGWKLHGEFRAYPYTQNDPNGILYIQAVIKELD